MRHGRLSHQEAGPGRRRAPGAAAARGWWRLGLQPQRADVPRHSGSGHRPALRGRGGVRTWASGGGTGGGATAPLAESCVRLVLPSDRALGRHSSEE